MRFRLITCEIFYREMCHALARSPHFIDIEFLPKGLHDIGAGAMRDRVQAVVDSVDESRYDAVLFGYALCNNGMAGITARTIPFVLPRAHDCITLFLGGRRRYLDYFHANPGTYFKTTGWMERGESAGEMAQLSIQRQIGMDDEYEEMVRKYGEDNARYLYDLLCDTTRNYRKIAFIRMGIEPGDAHEHRARGEAAERGWEFEKVEGDLSMIERLVNGDWDNSEFLVVPPGHRVVPSHDEAIVTAESVGGEGYTAANEADRAAAG